MADLDKIYLIPVGFPSYVPEQLSPNRVDSISMIKTVSFNCKVNSSHRIIKFDNYQHTPAEKFYFITG